MTARISAVHAALRALPGATLTRIQEQLNWRHLPVWEMEQLVAAGKAVRMQNTPGVHCVDGRYESVGR